MPGVEFQNLFPAESQQPAAPSVLEQRSGKWVEIRFGGKVRSATGFYDFITKDGTIYAVRVKLKTGGPKIGHIDMAKGQRVQFAGEIRFSGRRNRGQIRWWNNGSGHYQPAPAAAHQAGFPIELFREKVPGSPSQPGIPVE
ncbi:MAG: hypothetical protein ACREEM_09470 [Blastocatellia bacterium]